MNIILLLLSSLGFPLHTWCVCYIRGFINFIALKTLVISNMSYRILYESNYCYLKARSSSLRAKTKEEKFPVAVLKFYEIVDSKIIQPDGFLTRPSLCEAWRSPSLQGRAAVSQSELSTASLLHCALLGTADLTCQSETSLSMMHSLLTLFQYSECWCLCGPKRTQRFQCESSWDCSAGL